VQSLIGSDALLGDSAYRGHSHILAKPNRTDRAWSAALAYSISSDRSLVERTFGKLKAKFSMPAQRPRHLDHDLVANVLVIAAHLTNRFLRLRLPQQ
jgi:hypothetical protein